MKSRALFAALTVSALCLSASGLSAPAFAEGDPEKGESVFKKCRACHAVGDGAKNKVGPHLNDVIGRQAGTGEGFKYSSSMIEAGENGLVWTEDNIEAYLRDPRGFIPKNRMAFAGLKKDDEVDNVIAYIKQFSDGGDTSN